MNENELSKINELQNNIVLSLNLSIKNNLRYAGICIYNIDTNEFFLCEYIENDYYTTLESIIIQNRPITFLFLPNKDDADLKRIKFITNLCNIQFEELTKNEFNSASIENDLSKLLKENELKHSFGYLDLTLACKSLCSIIKYLSLLNDDNSLNKCSLNNYNINEYVKLDKAATVALNIFTDPSCGKKVGNNMTLYSFLNKCKTKIGERKLLTWVTHPLTNVEKINERLDIVEILKEDHITRSIIQSDYLRRICDLQIIIKKLKHISNVMNSSNNKNVQKKNGSLDPNDSENAKIVDNIKSDCTLEDLVNMYDCVVTSKKIFFCLNDYKGKHRQTLDTLILNPLKDILMSFDPFLKLIELTIDFDEIENNNFLISKKFDDTLKTLADKKSNIIDLIKDHREEIENNINDIKGSKKTGLKEDIKIVDCNTNTFIFRAAKKDISIIQKKKKEYITVRTNKNEILFTTNKLKTLCKQYETVLSDYNIIQKDLANKTIIVASSYYVQLQKISDIISSIDVFCSFAQIFSSSISVYVRPIIEENGQVIHMEKSRHPLIEANLILTNFIPNDISMNKETKRLNIITGPNMGGKSTYIRQIGLICLMCQIGCFAPCSYAKVPIFSQIMCRVGASDIQLKGISTFFSEMIEISAIVKNADEKCLIIIDELGRGTSTYEGFGISWSIASHILNNIKCFCLFATHFHELSNLEDEHKGAFNSHVLAKVDNEKRKISFLYEIKNGYADKSYGVLVAELAKLPKEVVEKAFEKSKELESVENRHHFKTQLRNQSNTNDKKDFISVYETILKNIFQADNENDFFDLVKSNNQQLKEIYQTQI